MENKDLAESPFWDWLENRQKQPVKFPTPSIETLNPADLKVYTGVAFFTLSSGGAMGRRNSMKVMLTDNNGIKIYSVFPFLENLEKIKSAFPEIAPYLQHSHLVQENEVWKIQPLGYGNFLYIKNTYYPSFSAKYQAFCKEYEDFLSRNNLTDDRKESNYRSWLFAKWKQIATNILMNEV